MFTGLGIDLVDFDVFAIKSRVHFRRGSMTAACQDTLLVEPDEPFFGTVRLDGLLLSASRPQSLFFFIPTEGNNILDALPTTSNT